MKINKKSNLIRNYLFIMLLIPVIFSAVSCSDSGKNQKKEIAIDSIIYKPGTKEPFNGTWSDSLNGVKLIFDVVNGKKEGNFKSYYPNGELLMSGFIKNNRNVGEWKYFYDNGNLESSGIFENDKPEGLWSWYYPDKTLRQTGYFHTGQRDSVWKTYDSTGTLIDSVVISDSTSDVLPR